MPKLLNTCKKFLPICLYIANIAAQIVASVCVNLIIYDYANPEGVSPTLLYILFVCIFTGFIVEVYKLAKKEENITLKILFKTIWSANDYFLAAMIISVTTAHFTNDDIKTSLMVYTPYLIMYWGFIGIGIIIALAENRLIYTTGLPDKGTKVVYNAIIMFAIMITIALCITPSIIPYIS